MVRLGQAKAADPLASRELRVLKDTLAEIDSKEIRLLDEMLAQTVTREVYEKMAKTEAHAITGEVKIAEELRCVEGGK